MSIDDLSALSATVLAISVANDRLVTIIKAAVPWLAIECKTPAHQVDLPADKWRRLAVLALALALCWFTTAFFADGATFDPVGIIRMGSTSAPLRLWVPLVALLASGGSALWSQVVGYTSALKDTQLQLRAGEGLANQSQAAAQGLATADARTLARSAQLLSAHQGRTAGQLVAESATHVPRPDLKLDELQRALAAAKAKEEAAAKSRRS